jgi:hypothetical protein
MINTKKKYIKRSTTYFVQVLVQELRMAYHTTYQKISYRALLEFQIQQI